VIAAGGKIPARAPSIAVGNGTIYVAWTVGETEHAAIHVASSRDRTTFTTPAIVEPAAGYADAPKLAVDTAGTLHLAFARTKDGPFVAAGVGGAFPSLAVDHGRVVITWEHFPRGDEAPHGVGIAYSDDGGASFTKPAVVPGTSDRGPNGGFEGRLMRKLAVENDAVVVMNSAKRPGESSRVWMVRGRLTPAA
jgi:hypothetical protein